jgi:hypothetical protein
MIGKEKRG